MTTIFRSGVGKKIHSELSRYFYSDVKDMIASYIPNKMICPSCYSDLQYRGNKQCVIARLSFTGERNKVESWRCRKCKKLYVYHLNCPYYPFHPTDRTIDVEKGERGDNWVGCYFIGVNYPVIVDDKKCYRNSSECCSYDVSDLKMKCMNERIYSYRYNGGRDVEEEGGEGGDEEFGRGYFSKLLMRGRIVYSTWRCNCCKSVLKMEER